MCSPAMAMGMQVGGAASSALGAYYGAQSTKTSLELQANLADINARVSESAAQATLLTGQREEQKSMLATANLKSAQRVGFASNGVDLGEGSPVNVLTTTDTMGQIDANTIKANAIKSAWGYRMQGVNQTNQANMSRAAASAIDPTTSAASSLLGSAGSVASSWYMFGKNGALDETKANFSSDPIASMNSSRGWTK